MLRTRFTSLVLVVIVVAGTVAGTPGFVAATSGLADRGTADTATHNGVSGGSHALADTAASDETTRHGPARPRLRSDGAVTTGGVTTNKRGVTTDAANAVADTADATANTADATANTADATANTADATVDTADATANTADATADTTEVATDRLRLGESRYGAQAATVTADFPEGTYSDQRGDVVTFSVDTEGSETVTIQVGSRRFGYLVNLTVADNGDSSVRIAFNTLLSADGAEAYTVVSEGDSFQNVEVAEPAPSVIDALNYPLRVWGGDTASGISDDQAAITIEDTPQPNLTAYTAPGGQSLDTLEAIRNTQLTRTNQTAVGDWLVYEIGPLPALEGYLADRGASVTPDQIRRLLTNDEQPYTLQITQRNPAINRDPVLLHRVLDSSNSNVVIGDDGNTVYLTVKTSSDLIDRELTGVYDSELTVGGFDTATLLDGTIETTRAVEFVNDGVTLTKKNAFARENGEIAGRTTLAPGTEITITIQSVRGVVPPLEDKAVVTVGPDRRFSAQFDFSDQSEGDKYRIQLTAKGRINATTTGVVQVNNLPQPSFTVTPDSPRPGQTVRLDASNSTDDGEIVSYEWDIDGDGEYGEFDEPSGETVTVELSEDGERSIGLRVTDDGGNTNTTTRRVVVRNTPPNATFDYRVDAGGNYRLGLDATASFDPDGAIESYEWRIDGEFVARGNTTTVTEFFQNNGPGTYNVTLVVTDTSGATTRTTQTVTVSNPPLPSVSAVQPAVGVGQPVTLTANDSRDPDGTVTSFAWTFGDGTTKSGPAATVEHTYSEPGNYTVRVRVTDNTGVSRTANTTVQVVEPPDVNVSVSPTDPVDDQQVTLEATTSATFASYAWDLDSDGAIDKRGKRITHRFPEPGRIDVTLRARTPSGILATQELTVQVGDRAPTASIQIGQDNPRDGQDVVFTANASAGLPGASIDQYKWDFNNDGEFDATGPTVSHAFPKSGEKVVVLQVTDQFGDTARTERVVTVRRSATFELSATQSKIDPGERIVVSLSARNQLPDTPVVAKLSLDLGSGYSIAGASGIEFASPGSTQFFEISGGGSASPTFRLQFNSAGNYRINATVTYFIGGQNESARRLVNVGPLSVQVGNPSTPTPTATDTATDTTGGNNDSNSTDGGLSSNPLVAGVIVLLGLLLVLLFFSLARSGGSGSGSSESSSSDSED